MTCVNYTCVIHYFMLRLNLQIRGQYRTWHTILLLSFNKIGYVRFCVLQDFNEQGVKSQIPIIKLRHFFECSSILRYRYANGLFLIYLFAYILIYDLLLFFALNNEAHSGHVAEVLQVRTKRGTFSSYMHTFLWCTLHIYRYAATHVYTLQEPRWSHAKKFSAPLYS